MKKLVFFTMAILMSISIYAQRSDNSDYWNTWEYTPKDGMREDFEKAAAKKTAMFNKTPETAIYTYRIITGPSSGTYVRVESNKTAADYDLDRSAEGKHWDDNVSNLVAKNSGQVRWVRLNNGTYNYNPESNSPAKYVQRTTFNVKADKVNHFRRFMSRIADVMEKRGAQTTRILFRLESGGNRNQFVVATTFDTYKREESPEQENTFREDYNDMFGWGSIEEDSENFDASLEYWGEQVETMQFVPEMSTKL
jgi:hypothetical protein